MYIIKSTKGRILESKTYNNIKDAEQAADFFNMGSDTETAIVVKL